MDERFDERLLDAAVNGEISHGSYTYHNVLIGGKDTYVVNFDRYKNECQISDLYQFIRKVMEKYNWEIVCSTGFLMNMTEYVLWMIMSLNFL